MTALQPKKRIRVLVVDDSATVRRVLTAGLARFADIEVVGTAPDPYVARDMVVTLEPDVLTLDIEMPRMDGLSFLDKLMTHKPVPVIVVSSLGKAGGEIALQALSLGAVDFVGKPGSAFSVADMTDLLAEKIRTAAFVDIKKLLRQRTPQTGEKPSAPLKSRALLRTTQQLIAIGASTGGTIALEKLLRGFPADCPGTVVVQHMPEKFTKAFAKRLDTLCPPHIREASQGEPVLNGQVLLAPGNHHVEIFREGGGYRVKLHQGEKVCFQRPSADVLFQSVSQHAGKNAVGILLTGMGNDGAVGLKAMKNAGARTIAQNEETCVVFGMPKAAIALDAATRVLPLQDIAQQAMKWSVG